MTSSIVAIKRLALKVVFMVIIADQDMLVFIYDLKVRVGLEPNAARSVMDVSEFIPEFVKKDIESTGTSLWYILCFFNIIMP